MGLEVGIPGLFVCLFLATQTIVLIFEAHHPACRVHIDSLLSHFKTSCSMLLSYSI